jgi:thioredoxin 1
MIQREETRSFLNLIITKKLDLDMATTAIKFYASWCGPCKVYAKTWDKVTSEISDVEFINVDIEKDTTGLAAKHKVMNIPHTVIIKDGVTKAETGRLNETQLKNLILN